MQTGVNGGPRVKAYVSNSGAVLTSGSYNALGIEQTGIFRAVKGEVPTAVAKPQKKNVPKFTIGFGKPKSAQEIARKAYKHRRGFTKESPVKPIISEVFSPSDIVSWSGISAKTQGNASIWALGYDGVNADKTLKIKYNNKKTKITIKAWGQPIQQFTGGQDAWYEEFIIDKEFCMDLCTDEECTLVDQDKFADKFLEQFNRRAWNADLPFNKFIQARKIRITDSEESPIEGLVEFTKYCISVCDDGTTSSLGQLQTQYPGAIIEQEGRQGSTSTYSVWLPTSSGAPSNAVISAPVAYEVCGTCPSGYTYSEGINTVLITRVLAPSDNITGGSNQQTYANTVLNAYIPTKTFNGTATGVDETDDEITITAHGFPANTPVVYGNGGGTDVGGLTDGETYYVIVVDENTIQLSETPGGEAIDLSVGVGTAHTLKPVSTATFVGADNGTATIQISYPTTLAAPAAINSDEVSEVITSGAVCIPPAGTSVSWSSCGTCQKAPKSWVITLADTECGKSRLAELQAAYPELVITEITPSEDAVCARAYTTTTYSNCVEPGCYPDGFNFQKPEPFANEIYWEEYSGSIVTTPSCSTEEETEVCKAVGIIFEGGTFYNNFSDCLYGYYDYQPNDFIPVHFSVSVADLDHTTGIECDPDELPVTKLKEATLIRGRGDYVRQVEKESNLDENKIWMDDLAVSSAFGAFPFAADTQTFYDEYTLVLKKNLDNNEGTGVRSNSHVVAYKWFVPKGKGKDLENLINPLIISLDNPELSPVIL